MRLYKYIPLYKNSSQRWYNKMTASGKNQIAAQACIRLDLELVHRYHQKPSPQIQQFD